MSGFVKLFFCVSFRWTDPLKSTCMPHSSCSCCVISVFLYRYMISVSFSTLQPGTYTHETLCAHVCVCMCVRLCMFFIMWYGGFARWCYSTGRIALSCLMLLAVVCASVCVPTVSTHVPFRMPFSCVYAHVRACSAAHVLWYHVVFDVLVQVRFGTFFLEKSRNVEWRQFKSGPRASSTLALHTCTNKHTHAHTHAPTHTRDIQELLRRWVLLLRGSEPPCRFFFFFFLLLSVRRPFFLFFLRHLLPLCVCVPALPLSHTHVNTKS